MTEPKGTRDPEDPTERFPELDQLKTSWNEETGQLVRARGLMDRPSRASPEDTASRFLQRYASILGGKKGDILADLALDRISHSPAGYEVTYRQVVDDVPVFQGEITVFVTNSGQIYGVDNYYIMADRVTEEEKSARILLEKEEAERIAQQTVGASARAQFNLRSQQILFVHEGVLQPAWRVELTFGSPPEGWLVVIAANDGDILMQRPILPTPPRGDIRDRQSPPGKKK